MGLGKQLSRNSSRGSSSGQATPTPTHTPGSSSHNSLNGSCSRSSSSGSRVATGTAGCGMGVGSVGWQAPEVMNYRRMRNPTSLDGTDEHISNQQPATATTEPHQNPHNFPSHSSTTTTSRSIDIFSLGCVFFTTLIPNRHPFGEWYERESNILHNDPDTLDKNLRPLLELTGGSGVEAHDLIRSMIQVDPRLRPTAAKVCRHAFFWGGDKRMGFLCDLSDRIETLCLTAANAAANAAASSTTDPCGTESLALRIEQKATSIIGLSWEKNLDASFLQNATKRRVYDPTSVRDLLRMMRNKYHHFDELPPEVRESLGLTEDGAEGLIHYFGRRFPKLLMHCLTACSDFFEGGDGFLKKYGIDSNVVVHKVQPVEVVDVVNDDIMKDALTDKRKSENDIEALSTITTITSPPAVAFISSQNVSSTVPSSTCEINLPSNNINLPSNNTNTNVRQISCETQNQGTFENSNYKFNPPMTEKLNSTGLNPNIPRKILRNTPRGIPVVTDTNNNKNKSEYSNTNVIVNYPLTPTKQLNRNFNVDHNNRDPSNDCSSEMKMPSPGATPSLSPPICEPCTHDDDTEAVTQPIHTTPNPLDHADPTRTTPTLNTTQTHTDIHNSPPNTKQTSPSISIRTSPSHKPKPNLNPPPIIDTIIWSNSTLSKSFRCRGWFRSDADWSQSNTSTTSSTTTNPVPPPRKRDQILHRLASDPKFRTRLCNHWDASRGKFCPMRKKQKCIFAHGSVELRVKEGKRGRWGILVDEAGNNSNPRHSGGEDTYGAARNIEIVRREEGKWKTSDKKKQGDHGSNNHNNKANKANKTLQQQHSQQQQQPPKDGEHTINSGGEVIIPSPSRNKQSLKKKKKP